jgi:prevent-host-death family protein
MTMINKAEKAREVPAGEFKAKCLALLDEVGVTGETLVITKRGRPVAKLVPADDLAPRSLLGSVRRERDIVSPTGEVWEAES